MISFVMLPSCAASSTNASPSYAYESAEAISYSSSDEVHIAGYSSGFSSKNQSRKDEDTPEAEQSGRSGARMITYAVELTLSVKGVENARKTLIEKIKACNGFITMERSDEYTDLRIIARIPAGSMDQFVDYAKTLGRVDRERKTGEDITDRYRDNVIRLESLRNARDKYMSLLEKAESVNEILSIEKELERVNSEIEIIAGRIKYAEESVALSSITVNLNEKLKLGPLSWIFYGLYCGIEWLFVWD
jgi:hypothetical protein